MSNDWSPFEYRLIERFGVSLKAVERLHRGWGTTGEVCIVDHIRQCDFCEKDGPVDFKTKHGPWAHGCEDHWIKHRMYGELGTGKAQVWVYDAQE